MILALVVVRKNSKNVVVNPRVESSLNDCLDELVSTEHLTAFSVIEYYCDICGDLTPHHIDDSKRKPTGDSTNTTFVPPISVHECVLCREEEENKISGLNL